ncbi:MAG TPA: pirin-like C-terminal cupin domain-containing protein, partial [Leptospiraceae bacterium]|nr:pirin-like C-terminal cupin domain-containing protein [Leptospiraceae bacterium]
DLVSDMDAEIRNGKEKSRLLLLQGRPINEPVVQYGPFVMNSRQEIQEAYDDYVRTEFGGWPWNSGEPVHGNEGRFAKYPDGKKEVP